MTYVEGSATPSYAEIVSVNINFTDTARVVTNPSMVSTFHQRRCPATGGPRPAIASTVSMNQPSEEQEHRAKSVIISGLAPCPIYADNKLVQDLFKTELGLVISPKYCKRLGQSAESRIGRLLVVLSCVEHANEVLARARLLRRSKTEYVRDKVYINRNLTAVEAQMEYRERCRRRQQRVDNDN